MPEPEGPRVSTLELFFDLVFVFAITQVTALIDHDPTWSTIAQAVLVFGNLWWMYGGYVWLTNSVPPRSTSVRLMLLAGMGAFLVCSLAIPGSFGDSGVAFGIGYLVVNLIHSAIFLTSSQDSVLVGMRRLGPLNMLTAVAILVAGFTGGAIQWALWTAVFLVHWMSPVIIGLGGFTISAGHFVERHGLMLLIAIGESVIAVGFGVSGDLTLARTVTALSGLTVAACLWWWYFDGEDTAAEAALAATPEQGRARLAVITFGHVFLVLLMAIVLFAAGVNLAMEGYARAADWPTAWLLAAGPALYLLGMAAFRRLLGTGPAGLHLIVAAACLATAPIGHAVSGEWQLVGLVATLVAGLVARNPRWLPLPPTAAPEGAR